VEAHARVGLRVARVEAELLRRVVDVDRHGVTDAREALAARIIARSLTGRPREEKLGR